MFHEILGLKRNKEKDKRIPWFRSINWFYFFFCKKKILNPNPRLHPQQGKRQTHAMVPQHQLGFFFAKKNTKP
jgi:hypothetical protein